MLGCGDAKWCGMTYGLRGSGVRAISATCSGREVVEPGARAKTSVLDAIGCHGRDSIPLLEPSPRGLRSETALFTHAHCLSSNCWLSSKYLR